MFKVFLILFKVSVRCANWDEFLGVRIECFFVEHRQELRHVWPHIVVEVIISLKRDEQFQLSVFEVTVDDHNLLSLLHDDGGRL